MVYDKESVKSFYDINTQNLFHANIIYTQHNAHAHYAKKSMTGKAAPAKCLKVYLLCSKILTFIKLRLECLRLMFYINSQLL